MPLRFAKLHIFDSIQENPEQSHWKHHFLSIHKQVYMQIISKSLIQRF
ncbi:unnamed protein product [Brassica rapa subsp. trilocularis]